MDFTGPFPTSVSGSRQILVFVDYLIRYTEIVPFKDRTAVTVVEIVQHGALTRH